MTNDAMESPCDGVSMRLSVSAMESRRDKVVKMESPCDGPVAMECLDIYFSRTLLSYFS